MIGLPKPWLMLGAGVLAFLGGWTVNGWRLGTEISDMKTEHVKAIADAQELTRIAQRDANLQRDKLATVQATIDAGWAARLKEAKDETQTLRDCVDRGDCGLRVRATCPARPDPVPSAAAGGIVDPGAGPELDADARRNYFALRDGIATVTNQLGACQETLRARGQ